MLQTPRATKRMMDCTSYRSLNCTAQKWTWFTSRMSSLPRRADSINSCEQAIHKFSCVKTKPLLEVTTDILQSTNYEPHLLPPSLDSSSAPKTGSYSVSLSNSVCKFIYITAVESLFILEFWNYILYVEKKLLGLSSRVWSDRKSTCLAVLGML